MKSNIFNFYVAILLAIVSIRVQGDSIADILDKMAKKNESIGNIFKPSKNGSLARKFKPSENGSPGEVEYRATYYRGKLLLNNNKEVMVKFTSNKTMAMHEYKIYTYLGAINIPDVEAFGVPAIYYYGTWNRGENEYTMMAMTLLDNTFNEKFDNGNFNEIDFLIGFRDFVRITKYIHSRGVFFNDNFNLHQVMYRKHMGFIIDFNNAKSFGDRAPDVRMTFAQMDWRQFFVEISKYIAKHKDWLGLGKTNSDDVRQLVNDKFVRGPLEGSETPKEYQELREVFIEFAKYAYWGSEIRLLKFHDKMYETIVKKIAKLGKGQKTPAVFSWLTEAERKADKISIPPISKMKYPFELVKVEYPTVNYKFFYELYRE